MVSSSPNFKIIVRGVCPRTVNQGLDVHFCVLEGFLSLLPTGLKKLDRYESIWLSLERKSEGGDRSCTGVWWLAKHAAPSSSTALGEEGTRGEQPKA